jgi:hypothetical protein
MHRARLCFLTRSVIDEQVLTTGSLFGSERNSFLRTSRFLTSARLFIFIGLVEVSSTAVCILVRAPCRFLAAYPVRRHSKRPPLLLNPPYGHRLFVFRRSRGGAMWVYVVCQEFSTLVWCGTEVA